MLNYFVYRLRDKDKNNLPIKLDEYYENGKMKIMTNHFASKLALQR